MEEAARIILWCYLGFLGFSLLLYLPRILYWIAAFLPMERARSEGKSRFAVIVPAREEGEVLAGALQSLLEQDYDPACYDIYVVVKGKDDPSREVASRFPRNEVLDVPGQRSKAEALDGALKEILGRGTPYDAYIFVDADNLAAQDFLSQMNNAMALGKDIVIGKKLIKNFFSDLKESRSFSSDSTSLTYAQLDELGNRARTMLGAPVALVGTGMLVSSRVIEQNGGWPYRSLTEDYELGADAILKGWTSCYYPWAKVYTEETVDAKGAYQRRIRWIKGYGTVHSRYRSCVWKASLPKGKGWIKVGFIFGRAPIYMMFGSSFLASFAGLAFLILSLCGMLPPLFPALLFLVPLLAAYLLLLLLNLVTVIKEWKNMPIGFLGKMSLIFLSPFYNLTYFPIFLTCLRKDEKSFSWEKTPRASFRKRD